MQGAYWFAVGVLATWRITHLLAAEDGPWDLLVRLRIKVGSGLWGRLLDCFYCLSVWTAVPFALLLGNNWVQSLVLWPALSGGAALLERLSRRREGPSVPYYLEDSEEADGLLRGAAQEDQLERDLRGAPAHAGSDDVSSRAAAGSEKAPV